LLRKLQQVESWDLSNLSSLGGYPRDQIFRNEEHFSTIKKGFKKQIKERLAHLKFIEEELKGAPTGHDLEYKIRQVSNFSGVDGARYFFGTANIFNHYFDQQQKKVIYELLNRITENVRWKGIDWYRIFKERED
jgi:hypothetical protein